MSVLLSFLFFTFPDSVSIPSHHVTFDLSLRQFSFPLFPFPFPDSVSIPSHLVTFDLSLHGFLFFHSYLFFFPFQIPSLFPVIMLHLISLYAGSRSLSRLHLHVFLPLQNFRLVLREIFDISFAAAQRIFPDEDGSKTAHR